LQQLVIQPRHPEAKAAQGNWLAGYQLVITQVLRTYDDSRMSALLPKALLPTAPLPTALLPQALMLQTLLAQTRLPQSLLLQSLLPQTRLRQAPRLAPRDHVRGRSPLWPIRGRCFA